MNEDAFAVKVSAFVLFRVFYEASRTSARDQVFSLVTSNPVVPVVVHEEQAERGYPGSTPERPVRGAFALTKYLLSYTIMNKWRAGIRTQTAGSKDLRPAVRRLSSNHVPYPGFCSIRSFVSAYRWRWDCPYAALYHVLDVQHFLRSHPLLSAEVLAGSTLPRDFCSRAVHWYRRNEMPGGSSTGDLSPPPRPVERDAARGNRTLTLAMARLQATITSVPLYLLNTKQARLGCPPAYAREVHETPLEGEQPLGHKRLRARWSLHRPCRCVRR